jgi:GT2 family glycosyltransferase
VRIPGRGRGALVHLARSGLGQSGPARAGTGPSRVPLQIQYRVWRSRVEPGASELQREGARTVIGRGAGRLLIVMPAREADAAGLSRSVRSLLQQPYPDWTLLVSSPEEMTSHGVADPRVRWLRRPERDHWSGAIAAHDLEAADWIALMLPGERLTRHGLVRMAQEALEHRDCDLMYSDWDEITWNGGRSHPHFSYGWSPELLTACDVLGGLVMQRRELWLRSGGWRADDAPGEAYGQLLRSSDLAAAPRHVAVMALSRPSRNLRAEGSGLGPSARPSGHPPLEARRRIVERWLSDRGSSARVEVCREAGRTDLLFDVEGEPEVDVVIPLRDRWQLLDRCLAGLRRSTYRHLRITVVDNGSTEGGTVAYLRRLSFPVVSHPGPFNFSALVNHGVSVGTAPFILLLNNDTVVSRPNWAEAMLGWLAQPRIGAVGARLTFADGRVQHEGIGIGIGRLAANLDLGWSATRACSAVTGACMMVRRTAYERVGGFDEGLPVAFNDVDFCLRLWAAGWRVIVTPSAEMRHDEGSSRGAATAETDYQAFCARWGEEERLRDAFLGPHIAWPKPLTLRVPRRTARSTG